MCDAKGSDDGRCFCVVWAAADEVFAATSSSAAAAAVVPRPLAPAPKELFAQVGRVSCVAIVSCGAASDTAADDDGGASSSLRVAVGHSCGLIRVTSASSSSAAARLRDAAAVLRIRPLSQTALLALHSDGCIVHIAVVADDEGGASSSELSALACWRLPPFAAPATDFAPLPRAAAFPHAVSPLQHVDEAPLSLLVGGSDPTLAVVSPAEQSLQMPQRTTPRAGVAAATLSAAGAVGRSLASFAGRWLRSAVPPPPPPPQPKQQQQHAQQQSSTNTMLHVVSALRDVRREVATLAMSPSGRFAAAADSLGRVLVVDTAAGCVVVRMFKGYRDAQCVWTGDESRELVSLRLAVHVPRLAVVDVWAPLSAAPLARIPLTDSETRVFSWRGRLFAVSLGGGGMSFSSSSSAAAAVAAPLVQFQELKEASADGF